MTSPCICDGNGSILCVECQGEGGWHDCGEDCCCCLDPEEITDVCPDCDGTGVLVCRAHEENR